MDINYKLLYEIGPLDDAVSAAARKVAEAQKTLEAAKNKREIFISKYVREAGFPDYEHTNIACAANGVLHHIYAPGSGQKDIGKRKCIFCGLDDFDF